jgi:hypothetical protein
MARKLFGVGLVILGWFSVNVLGVAASAGLSLLLSYLISIQGMLVSSLIIGLPMGFVQWIALRRVTQISMLWTLTISVGLFLGLVVSPILARILGLQDDESVISLTAAYTTMGLLVGLAQWLVLRGQFTRAWVWPLSSALGFGLGLGLVLATDLINRSGIISFFLAVLVYAIATGLVIAWLPALRRKTESNLVNTT